jgi:hypothetical protein
MRINARMRVIMIDFGKDNDQKILSGIWLDCTFRGFFDKLMRRHHHVPNFQ